MDALPRDKDVISDPSDLADALIRAFVEGNAETRQHIVDTLGERSRAQQD